MEMYSDMKKIIDGEVAEDEDIIPKKHSMHCIHPFWLEHSIFKSLHKLKLETIDCVYLHDPLENVLKITKGDVLQTRNKLKEAF